MLVLDVDAFDMIGGSLWLRILASLVASDTSVNTRITRALLLQWMGICADSGNGCCFVASGLRKNSFISVCIALFM